MASVKTSQSWTITDIQCHLFIQPCLSESKIETATFLSSYDPYPKIFCPWGFAGAKKWTILRLARVTVSSAIRRRPAATSDEQSSAAPPSPPSLPACRDFSTWASNRDLWQWILKSRFLSFVILKVSRGKVEILSKEIIRIRCFQINKENWWWWIHFSRSLTLAALKGALVTLCRPLWAVFRKSFNTKEILISKIGH